MIKITGSTGFVGKNLLSYLKQKEIALIDRNLLNHITPNALNSASAIIHLAGKAHDLKKTSNPEEYYQVNFELTKKLYDAFLQSDAKKFIFVSSVKAVADKVVGVLTEETVTNPQSDYGKSKLMAEQYIAAQPLPDGKSYYILRPCMIHGPGNKGNLNLLYEFVKKGIPYPLAAFNNQRSFLSVENLCFVINELIENPIVSGTYNLADDEPIATTRLINEIATSLKVESKLWKVPQSVIKFCAAVGDFMKLPLNTDRLEKLTSNYIVSNEKIKKALAKDLPISTISGIKKTILAFQQ